MAGRLEDEPDGSSFNHEMTRDELVVMDGGKCILTIRGIRPFFSNKFDITKHKRCPMFSDYDRKNTFDVEKYPHVQSIIRTISPAAHTDNSLPLCQDVGYNI